MGNKISTLTAELCKLENKYLTSLTDPTVDSVELQIEIRAIKAEMVIANEIFHKLFPEHNLMS